MLIEVKCLEVLCWRLSDNLSTSTANLDGRIDDDFNPSYFMITEKKVELITLKFKQGKKGREEGRKEGRKGGRGRGREGGREEGGKKVGKSTGRISVP